MIPPFTPRSLVAVLALVLAIAACGDDDDPASTGKADTTPPTVSSATAIDANHVEIAFGEDVDRNSAEDPNNYEIVEGEPLLTASSAPGDPLPILALALGSDQRTLSLTTADMDSLRYDITISGVKDKSGNAIATPVVSEYVGTTDEDVTPPEIAYRSPGPNATGVLTSASLVVTFSERVTNLSLAGTTWTSTGGDVDYLIDTGDAVHVVFTPMNPLALATVYTITLPAVQDEAGNTMASTSWSFTTTGTADQVPPTVVSSDPAHLATNVSTETDAIAITFSEPMQPSLFFGGGIFPFLDVELEWLDGGRILRFNLYQPQPLAEDQQYVLSILPNSLFDLAGNTLALTTIVFTTGYSIARGGIAGTLRGDSQSDYADDPTGALVFALTDVDYDVAGTDVVAGNKSYSVQHLPDGDYFVYAAMESNGDGVLDLGRGDAFGVFGADPRAGDFEEEIVTISGGSRLTGINFGLFDPSVISGVAWYGGQYIKDYHWIVVGLFDINGYDPLSEPDYSSYASWPEYPEFWFDGFDNGPSEGTFYIGAFLDINGDFFYDPAEDPAVFYDDPQDAITVENGSDLNDIALYLQDPVPGTAATAIRWPAKKSGRGEWLGRISAAMQKSDHKQQPAPPK